MSRRLHLGLAFAFAVLLTSCFPRVSAWYLSYVALLPLLYGIFRVRSGKDAFLFSYLAGFLFLLLSLFWLRHVTPLGLVVFALIDAVTFGLFGWAVKILFDRHVKSNGAISFGSVFGLLLAVPALWVIQEWARLKMPVIGYGFNFLGAAHAEIPIVAQGARIFGVFGLSYLSVVMNVALFLTFARQAEGGRPLLRWKQYGPMWGLVALFMAAVILYGKGELTRQPRGRVLRVGVVQGNIPQEDKWDLRFKALIIEKYKKLSELAKFDGPDLLVWPEAAWPGYFEKEYTISGFPEFIRRLNVPLVVGAPQEVAYDEVYNSAIFVTPAGDIVDHFDKVNLVPFGEYVPWGAFFRLIGIEQYARAMGVSDFAHGKASQPLLAWTRDRHTHRFAPLICFEDGFPDYCRLLVERGSEFLLVMTNDAWFGSSAAPYQHLQCSIMRAIENGVYVVRAANTGVSAFINPLGQVEDRVKDAAGHDIFVAGGLTRPIFTESIVTSYRKFGFLFPIFCVFLALPAFLLRPDRF